jgi:hypothetical protein
MNRQTLHIGFGGHQVAVHSEAPEVLEGVERRFGRMLESEPTNVVRRLEVHRDDQTYSLAGHAEGYVERGALPDILRRLDYEVVLQLVEARPDLLWFHAGAAACGGGAVVFLGMWGQGKSTLVTSLYAQGWTYLSDDVVPLDPNSDRVIPFPQTPRVREGEGQELPRYRLRRLEKTEVALDPERVCREALSVRAFIFPQYDPDALANLEPCSPAAATLELLQHCINFTSHRGAAVRYLGDLVTRRPALRLSFNDGQQAAVAVIQACQDWLQT